MKKLLFFIILTFHQLSTNAETYNVVIDGIKYELTYVNKGGSTYTNAVVIANSYSGDIVIPVSVTYNGIEYNVTSIGNSAFSGCSSLTSITVPNNVTSIGNSAFSGCRNLTSITIPESVTNIGISAFAECNGLKKVIVADIAAWCGITFGSNPLCYAHHLYNDESTEIKDLVIPNNVTSIGNSAFSGCTGLASVTITNGVTSIGGSAFSDCTGLASVTIPESVTDIGGGAFSGCTGLASVTITNGVTSIGRLAFSGCRNLTSITIPKSVTNIGDSAFSGCSGLKKVIVADIAAWCGITFDSNPSSNPLHYAHHLYNDESTEIKDLVIPNSVTDICSYAFSGCTGLASVTITNGETSIGSYAFKNCTGLASVTITNSVIGSYAFLQCTGLTQVSIGSGIIGNDSFEDCNSLTSLTIGNGVKSIESAAFKGCSSLTSVTIGTGIKTIYGGAFASCPELTDVYCYAENVPTTSSTAFKDSYIEYATLHVPDVSIELYKQANPWNTFKVIVPIGGDDPTIIAPIHSVVPQKASYNLNGMNISKANKSAKGVIIRDGKKYYIR